jgi:hypothetical protein
MLEIMVNHQTYHILFYDLCIIQCIFPLQVNNKPHERAFECAFILGIFSTPAIKYIDHWTRALAAAGLFHVSGWPNVRNFTFVSRLIINR